MDQLAAACEQIASYSSRRLKIEILAGYLHNLDQSDLHRAVHFLANGPLYEARTQTLFGNGGQPPLSIGGTTLRRAICDASGWDAETVRLCATEVGDSGETAALLMEGRTTGAPMTLAAAQDLYTSLARTATPARKLHLLREVFTTYRPGAVKYWIKIISGNLRIGLQAKMVEEAVALSTGAPLGEVRAATNRLGDLARVALAARDGVLATVRAELFHPMEFMLAKPLDSVEALSEPSAYIVEDKYDGVRAQLHFENGRAMLFTRGMDEVTQAFPEIDGAARLLTGSAVLDGEVLAWKDSRALPFNLLQQRVHRKRAAERLAAAVPVAYVAYDILFRDGEMLVDLPIEQRRAALEEVLRGAPTPLLLTPRHGSDAIAKLFEEARNRGNEGLMFKRRGSLYEPGKRSGAWFKLKRPFATLDVVITAAEQGHGRRATVLSDYTFAVKSGDGFANIGKAYSGLTDAEVRELTRLLRGASTGKFGRVVLVEPSIVLEVAFDGIQKSPRHKSGFALRFPRILRWRKDKSAEHCDGLERVRALYESSLNLTATPDA